VFAFVALRSQARLTFGQSELTLAVKDRLRRDHVNAEKVASDVEQSKHPRGRVERTLVDDQLEVLVLRASKLAAGKETSDAVVGRGVHQQTKNLAEYCLADPRVVLESAQVFFLGAARTVFFV
jgi:hypothetical protein